MSRKPLTIKFEITIGPELFDALDDTLQHVVANLIEGLQCVRVEPKPEPKPKPKPKPTTPTEDSRHRPGAGYTIPKFAKHYGIPESQVRRSVRDGTIKTVPWAGLLRIPPSEAERVSELWGLRAIH